MNYEKMWKRLNQEVNFLIEQKVEGINPILLKGYMDFIVDVIDLEEKHIKFKDKLEQLGEDYG